MPYFDKFLLRKRAVIESVNDQLKNISQIEHSRHRSVIGFFINILSDVSAYNLQKKPSIYPKDIYFYEALVFLIHVKVTAVIAGMD